MSTDDTLPGVPDIEDSQPNTPVSATFETGTANDPAVGTDGDEPTTVTINGEPVTVPPGSTVIDAMQAVSDETVSVDPGEDGVDDDADVPALCYYDRDGDCSGEIGPRSECRTCMVETDEHGLVPSCSFPAEEGLSVQTDTPDAEETRSVNLDLVLSNHNLRCTTCNGNGRCELQDTAISEGVDHPRYGVFDDRDEYEPLDDSSSFIQIDRNKCILCNRCVEGCNDVQVEGVLRIEGHGEDTRIGFQSDAETMAESDCVSCGHCATVCPTGALTEKDIGGAATLPLPGFTQRNSIGTVIEHEEVETLDDTTAPNRSPDPGGESRIGAGPSVSPDDRSGVARFMSQSRRRAMDIATEYGHKAMLAGEHTAENIATKVLPEGRLFDVASTVSDYRLGKIDKEETTCGFCAVGCRFEMWGKDGDAIGVQPVEDPAKAPANNFSTCVKGKFGHEFANSDERITEPLVRNEDGEFETASWDEALDRVASGLRAIQDEHGIDAVGCLASSKGSNEEAYLVQKFARQVLGTKNIDNCARLCHSTTVAALQQTLGYGAMTNRINEDVGEADAYLITGSNTTESHPVLATRIKQNVRDGADLIVFDPREVNIAEHADQYTRTRPGYDVAWINGLIRYIIENDLHDEAFIERNTKGFEKVKEKVQAFTPENVEELAGVPPAELKSAAETLAEADTVVFGWAMGMTQSSHGTQNLLAMADLALTLGQVGKPGAGLSPFRGQNNVQGGGGDMGTLPGSLPGYQDPADAEVAEKFEKAWGERPPEEPGLKVPEMLSEAHEGNLRGMYVVGENPALSEPDIQHAEAALEKLEFLVVQDIFMTETATHADVILPAATSPEKHGTFTNTERRIQRVRPTATPPGTARQDWEITQDLANRLGYSWDYDHPREIMDEISDLVPIYGGVSYDRLESGDEHGLQWPCWDEDHPGTPYLYDYEDGEFNFDDGMARFVPADGGHPGELPDEEYPLTLTSGRVLYHWHTGQITRRVEGLMSHVGESFVEINPSTADELGVADGEYVQVESRRGDIVVKANVTDRVGEGTLFIPMHFAAGAVNKLTQESFDPHTGIPEYKVSSVRVEPLGSEANPDVLRAPDAGADSDGGTAVSDD
ncbi:formate dehydrogenase, alpha subunit (plasmid) [Haloterrigena turkmenica DSM 5511]|uniref:Formate dehydrogenase, alpha subunit n=1 Tax=Haloterrigena turkmenica (strain ATCC 51198 / DSM 5511 / JCM 9101 / NCIMB 13204 / VKM B-1734 / 4k) TaxID=543526 RepID=D2S2C2_HALTV|nr:formate dehydrogenase subunit alpha [Haloterrigena turkmenica]ADB63519.1 formate dehydrogenase, alpha subunit [Haloterrigena turkmenica DSM 5511]